MVGPLKIGETVFYVGTCEDLYCNKDNCSCIFQHTKYRCNQNEIKIFSLRIIDIYLNKIKLEKVFGYLDENIISERIFNNYEKAKECIKLINI